jgi:hypothetical protein
MRLYTVSLTIALLTSITLVSCSGGGAGGLLKGSKDNKDSGDNPGDDTSNNNTSDQPVEVSGGFGLACEPSENPMDPSKADITCYFVNSEGTKFEKRDDITLDVNVTSVGTSVMFDETSLAYEFKFTILKADTETAFINAKFLSKRSSSSPSSRTPIVLADKSAPLKSLISASAAVATQ